MARSLLTFVLIALVSGCATYGQQNNLMLEKVKQGRLDEASIALDQVLKPEGDDALLYHLERGSLLRLQGQFEQSNQSLAQAYRLSQSLETESVSGHLLALLSNPTTLPYRGERYERILIHYLKALNYLELAQNGTGDGLTLLDEAGVEIRQLQLRLNILKDQADSEQASDDSITDTLIDVYEALRASGIDKDALRYKTDAWIHYLAGVRYEMAQLWDDARISYQKAASAYEEHFVEKLALDAGVTQQAWLDTLRMLRTSGDRNNEWQRLAKVHLSALSKDEIDAKTRPLKDGESSLVIIEHKGLVPERSELNLQVIPNPDLSSFTIQPYFLGDDPNALAWFYALYGDKGALGVASVYSSAKQGFAVPYGFSTNVFVGPLWPVLDELGVIRAMNMSVRVAVPYFKPHQTLPPSTLTLDNDTTEQQSLTLELASSPARLAIQELMLEANDYLRWALVRATVKAVTSDQAGSAVGGDAGALLSLVGNIAGQLAEAAETRSWLLLPAEIKMRRLRVSAGVHRLSSRSEFSGGARQQHTEIQAPNQGVALWVIDSPAKGVPKSTAAQTSETSQSAEINTDADANQPPAPQDSNSTQPHAA